MQHRMTREWSPLNLAVRDSLTRAQIRPEQRVWVAVSGGADSMALLFAVHNVHDHVGVIHVDHGLREGSGKDRDFVEAEANRLGLECRTHIAQNLAERAAQKGQGLEAGARSERYRWFFDVVGRGGVVLTGHHADDQKETQLLHWLRGSKVEGWQGMEDLSTERGYALGRPFLNIPKKTLLAALKSSNSNWREDPSNADPVHLRNRVRHELLPLLNDFRPGWSEGMQRASAMAKEWAQHTQALLHGLPPGTLPLQALNQAPSRRQMLAMWAKPYGFGVGQLDALLALSKPEAEVGTGTESIDHAVVRERDVLLIRPLPLGIPSPLTFSPHPEHAATGAIKMQTGILKWAFQSTEDAEIDTRDLSAQLTFDALTLPLTLRPWKPGDRMVPLGMTGHQSVSDILTQRKVPHVDRQNTLVVTSQGHPVWVVGHRIHRENAMDKSVDIGTHWILHLLWEPE